MEFTRKLVIKKVKQLFPEKDRDRIMEILDLYGVGEHESSRERIQLAILKLSQGNEVALRKHVEHAKIDQRDIRVLAEEPNMTQVFEKLPLMTEDEIEKIREKDLQAYQDWLKE